MNKFIGMGRLTRDPEIRYTQGANATAIARYSVAINRTFKREGEPEADFFNCTAFGKQAEFAEKFLKQGTKITFVGRLQNNNYTDKDGNKVYGMQIIIEEVFFAESKGASEGNGNGGNAAPASNNGGNAAPASNNGGNQGGYNNGSGYGNGGYNGGGYNNGGYNNGGGYSNGYNNNRPTSSSGFMNIPDGIDEELPFN